MNMLRPHQTACANPAAHRLGLHCYLGSILVSFVLWTIDQHFCVHLHNMKALPNPQFHAWWHVGYAVHMYSFATFITYQRQVYLGKFPVLRYALGVVPYVQNMPSKPKQIRYGGGMENVGVICDIECSQVVQVQQLQVWVPVCTCSVKNVRIVPVLYVLTHIDGRIK